MKTALLLALFASFTSSFAMASEASTTSVIANPFGIGGMVLIQGEAARVLFENMEGAPRFNVENIWANPLKNRPTMMWKVQKDLACQMLLGEDAEGYVYPAGYQCESFPQGKR